MANPLDSFKGLPAWGKAAVVGGGAFTLYFAYRYKKNHQAAASTSSTTSMVTDPSTGTQYPSTEVDPTTGETYSAEISQYGSVSGAESAVTGGYGSSAGMSLLGNESGLGYGASYSNGTDYGTTNASTVSFADDASWAQAAQAGLSGIGYTSTDVSAALGQYLAKMPLSSAQVSMVQAAIAEYGPPPVGSYAIIKAPASAPPPTTKPPAPTPTPAAKVVVPNVVGLEADQAGPIINSEGLTNSLSGPSFKTGGPNVRIITATNPKAGSSVAKGTHVVMTYKVQKNSLQPHK